MRRVVIKEAGTADNFLGGARQIAGKEVMVVEEWDNSFIVEDPDTGKHWWVSAEMVEGP